MHIPNELKSFDIPTPEEITVVKHKEETKKHEEEIEIRDKTFKDAKENKKFEENLGLCIKYGKFRQKPYTQDQIKAGLELTKKDLPRMGDNAILKIGGKEIIINHGVNHLKEIFNKSGINENFSNSILANFNQGGFTQSFLSFVVEYFLKNNQLILSYNVKDYTFNKINSKTVQFSTSFDINGFSQLGGDEIQYKSDTILLTCNVSFDFIWDKKELVVKNIKPDLLYSRESEFSKYLEEENKRELSDDEGELLDKISKMDAELFEEEITNEEEQGVLAHTLGFFTGNRTEKQKILDLSEKLKFAVNLTFDEVFQHFENFLSSTLESKKIVMRKESKKTMEEHRKKIAQDKIKNEIDRLNLTEVDQKALEDALNEVQDELRPESGYATSTSAIGSDESAISSDDESMTSSVITVIKRDSASDPNKEQAQQSAAATEDTLTATDNSTGAHVRADSEDAHIEELGEPDTSTSIETVQPSEGLVSSTANLFADQLQDENNPIISQEEVSSSVSESNSVEVPHERIEQVDSEVAHAHVEELGEHSDSSRSIETVQPSEGLVSSTANSVTDQVHDEYVPISLTINPEKVLSSVSESNPVSTEHVESEDAHVVDSVDLQPQLKADSNSKNTRPILAITIPIPFGIAAGFVSFKLSFDILTGKITSDLIKNSVSVGIAILSATIVAVSIGMIIYNCIYKQPKPELDGINIQPLSTESGQHLV
jgi:hypothetical protein